MDWTVDVELVPGDVERGEEGVPHDVVPVRMTDDHVRANRQFLQQGDAQFSNAGAGVEDEQIPRVATKFVAGRVAPVLDCFGARSR